MSQAMRHVFGGHERHALSRGQVEALTDLASRVRELTEALVLTDVDETEAAAVAAELKALTERLSVARRDTPPLPEVTPDGALRHLASPVTGALNPLAPPVDVDVQGDGSVRATFTLNAAYEGPPTFVHGGMSALILDQILGVAAHANGTPGMTATLDLRYRRPTPYGVPLTAEARAVRAEGRKSWAEARILNPEGKPTVEATAMFVMPQL